MVQTVSKSESQIAKYTKKYHSGHIPPHALVLCTSPRAQLACGAHSPSYITQVMLGATPSDSIFHPKSSGALGFLIGDKNKSDH